MKVHHLNCGTMRPPATPGGLVCHVLLVEAAHGLVLVDSGFGLLCCADPAARFGPTRHLVRPVLDPDESAVRQVQRLGFSVDDVRDVVLTHFDADHTGGLADFPQARVHLTAAENQASLHPRSVVEKGRYRPIQRSHGPRIVEHDPADGDGWRGFAAALEVSDVSPGVVLVGLPGHTRGHAAVAVDAGEHWVLHVGDACYAHRQLEPTGGAPRSLRAMEHLVAVDRKQVRANHGRLAEMWAHPDPDVRLVNAHDPELLASRSR